MRSPLFLFLFLLFLSIPLVSAACEDDGEVAFHDMRINPVDSFTALIEPEDPAVVELVKGFKSYADAYAFVAEQIRFVPYVPSGPVRETLRHGVGSCIGKAVLLSSIYRAMGMPKEDLRVVVGIVQTPQGYADHVWLDMELDGRCLQQDPSGMIGSFGFHAFPGNSYVDRYVIKESFCFNETHLAIVSQLNRVRHSIAH